MSPHCECDQCLRERRGQMLEDVRRARYGGAPKVRTPTEALALRVTELAKEEARLKARPRGDWFLDEAQALIDDIRDHQQFAQEAGSAARVALSHVAAARGLARQSDPGAMSRLLVELDAMAEELERIA